MGSDPFAFVWGQKGGPEPPAPGALPPAASPDPFAFVWGGAPPPSAAASPLPSDIAAAPPPVPGIDYNTAGSPEPGAWDLYGKPLIHTAAKAASLPFQGLGALAQLGVEAVRGTPPEQSLVQPDLEHADEPAAFTSPGIGNVAMREGFARPAAAMGEDLAALDRGDYRRAADLGLMAAIPGLSTLAGPEIPVKPEDPSQDVAVPAALRLAEPIAYGLGSLGAELPLVGGIFGAIGSKIPWVERAMAVGFTPEMLNAAYEGSVQAKDMAAKYGWLDPRTAEAVMGAVTSGAFGLLGLKHAAGPLRRPALTDVYRGKVPKTPVLGGAEDRTIPPPPIDPETGLPDVAPPQATPAEPGPSWFNRLLGRVPAPPVAPEQPPQTWSAEVPRSGMPSDILRSPQEVMLDQLEASGRPNDPGQQLGEFVPAPIEAGVGAWPEVPAGGPVDVSAAVKPEVRPAPAPAPAPAPEPISPESALSEVDARQAILDQLKLQGAPDVATDEMAAKYEAQRKQQADAEEAAAITASEEVKAQELQRSIEEALQKPPAEPRLAGDLARRAREEAARIRPRVGQMPTDQLRKAEAYYRSEGLIEPGDIAREELARREPGGPQYVAPGTEAKRPEPTQDLGIAADTGPSPLGPGEYQGEEPIPGYDKPLPPPATDLGSRTAEAEGRTTKVGDHYTIADAHGTGPTVEAIAPRLERYARSIGEIINGIGKSLGMRPIFRGLSTEYDFNAVRLPDGTIRLSPATILDAAKARAGNLGLEPGTPEYDAKVRRETARLSTHEAAHEIGHLAIEQEAARDPVLAAKLKEAPGSVEQLPEGLRYVSEETAARAAEKLGEGPHGRAFRSALAKILAKNRRSLHTAVGRLEASLVGDTELALQHLREAVDGSWKEHKASGGRGSDVGPDSGLLQSARREVGDEAEARARRERQGHADRLPVGGAGVGTRPGEAVPARPGERRAEPGAGTAVRGGEPERPGRVIPPVFDDNRGDYQLSVVDNARALVEAARKSGRDVVRTSSGVDIADGFTPGSKVISYVDRNGVAQAGALLHADGRISDLAQMRIGSPDVFRVLHAAAEAGGRLSPDISLSADSTRLIENIANRLGLDAKDIRSGKIALGDIIRLRGERAKRRFGPGLAERPVAGGAGEGVQRPGGAGADSAPRAEPKAEPALSRRREDRPAAEPDAGVAAPPEPEFSRRREEPKSEPLAEDDYAGKYLARVITPAAAAKNLTTHLAAQSGESNVSMIRDPINSRYGGIRDDKPFVVGPVTPEQWLARARAWIPDQKEWSAARDWYRQLRGRFEEVFGEGPEAVKNLIAWAQSQQNESSSGGMRNVRRAADLASGIDLRFPPGHKKAGQPMLAGMAHDKLIAAMLDAAKETGTAAKLSDFLDATFDRATRSWVGNDPRGGVPTPIDVWAGRDRGFVDEQMIGYARKAGMKWANKLSVDGAVSAPGRYESGIKFYREIADYLNENNVDGGKWTSTEAQAVGWTAMRRMAGIPDEGPRDIISKNARNLAFEAGAYGKGSEYAERFAGLTPEQQDRMNAIVGPRLIGEAASRSGVRVIQTTRGVGGYKEDSNANWDVRVFGSPEQVEDFARFLGLGAQQDSVVATRRMKSGKDPGWDFRVEQRPSGKALRSWWKMAQTKDPVFARGGFTVLSTPDGHLLRLFPGRPEDGRAFNRYLSHSGRMLDFAEIMGREFGVESIEQEPIRADNMWVGNDWSEGNGGKGYSDALKARGRRLDGFDDVARSIFDDAHATVTAEPGAVAEPVAQELPAYSRRREDVAARESYKPPTKEEAESIGTRPETDELRKRREEVGRDQTDRWLDARGPIKRDEYRYSRRREDEPVESRTINPDQLPREVLSRMAQRLEADGYGSRIADDVLRSMKSGRVFRDGKFTAEHWQKAYDSAIGSVEKRKATTAARIEATPRVNWKTYNALPTTSNPKKAGYIRPNGKLVDMSYGDIRRVEDHRIVGGLAAMQELVNVGHIRWMPEGNGLDVGKMPTEQQFLQIQALARSAEAKGEAFGLDMTDGLGAFDKGNSYYSGGRKASLEYPVAKPGKILGDIRRFFGGEDIESGARYSLRREDEGKPAPTFYSQLSRVAEKLPQAMSGRDMMRYLTDPKRSPGVRILDEAKWTGLDDFLTKNSDRKITPAEVQQYLRENEVKVEEVVKGEDLSGRLEELSAAEADGLTADEERELERLRDRLGTGPERTKFSQYQTPGGPLSRDTEILTEVGWKRMDVVQVGDVVLTRADAGGALTWESVEAVPTIHAAKLYHFKNQSVDMMVTADHQMVVKRRRTSAGLVRMRAEDLWVASECLIPLVGSPVPGGPGLLFGLPAEDVAEFIGWYIAEGSCPVRRGKKTTPSISQSREANPEKCARLEALLGRLGISWKYHDSGPSYTIHIRSMPKALVRVLHAQGTSREKRVPVALFRQPAVVISRFLDGLLLGDGSLARGEGRKPRWTLYTLSAQVADATQALAVLIGQHARIGRRPNGLWTVGFNCKQGASVDDAKAGLVEYNDTAFCVTVKNHAIYVRRNGIAAFTGNSNYRELLLTLPTRKPSTTGWTAEPYGMGPKGGWEVKDADGKSMGRFPEDTAEQAIERAAMFEQKAPERRRGKDFTAGHYDEPNVLAHVRFNERTDAEGKRVLFLEEIQSDWAQKGRREGFAGNVSEPSFEARTRESELWKKEKAGESLTPAERAEYVDLSAKYEAWQASLRGQVPSAPFVTDTKAWSELAMKRMVRWAAESGSREWHDATKPQGFRAAFDDLFGSKDAPKPKLSGVEASVLSAWKHDQVRLAVVEALPVDVVNMLSDKGITPESLFGKPDVVFRTLPVDGRAPVARGMADALGKVGARLRAALDSSLPAGRDVELLPALRASDLDPREVVGLLAPLRVSDASTDAGIVGRAPSTAKGSVERTPGEVRGVGDEPSTARLAELLNRHDEIVHGNPVKSVKKYEPGFDAISWTSGEMQAERYDLSKQIDSLQWNLESVRSKPGEPKAHPDAKIVRVVAMKNDGEVFNKPLSLDSTLDETIGKDHADRIRASVESGEKGGEFSGVDLKVGGEGMKGFYDQIIPQVAAKIGKKFGASVGKTFIKGDNAPEKVVADTAARYGADHPLVKKNRMEVHSLDISSSMRESVVQEGQSLFSRRRTDNAERVPSPEERVREVSGEPELGRSMLPGEAHRVDTKVAALKGVAPTVKLSRDSPRTWKSLDPKIQTLLNRVLADPDAEQKFYDKVRTGRVNDVETMAMDALRKAHEEAYQASAQAIAQARANGTDEGPANLAYLRASFGKLTEAYANAARSDVEAGTKLARALAARARVMSAAGRSAPDAFLTKIFREIPGVSNAQAAEMLRLFREDPSRLPDALHAAMNPSTWAKFIEFWKSGLVSALGGQIANVTSNVGEQLFRLGETVTAGLVDRMLPGDRARYSSEARAELEGGVSRLGYAFSRLGQQMKKIATMKPNEFNPDSPIEYQTGAIGQGGVAGRAIAKVIPGFHAGRAITMPLRTLSAMDGFFKDVGGDAEMAKLAHRQAVQELGRGATQRAIRARKAEIVSEILDPNNTDHSDILEAVAKAKLARTFQDPGNVIHAIQNLKRTLPPLDIVMPFLSTPGRILEMTRQRTPLGFVDALQAAKSWRAAVEKGSDVETIARLRGETVDALARPLLGTALIATFALLAKSGAMTGGGPTDKKAKNLKRDINWQPYSFVFDQPDGSKFYLPFTRWLEPVSGLLGISADIGEFGDPSKASEYLDRGMALVKDNFLDKSWWTGVTDVVDAVQDPGSKGAAYGSRLVGSLIPNIVAKAAQAYDPVIRDVRPSAEGVEGIGERIKKTVESRIPGLTQRLPERRSGTGEPIRRQGQGAIGAALRFASPVVPSTEAPGRKLEEVLISLDEVQSAPRKEMTLYGRKMKLTDSEYSLIQDYDQKASNYLREYIARSGWDSLSEEDQRRVVRSMYARAGDMARAALLREPGFIQRLSARQ